MLIFPCQYKELYRRLHQGVSGIGDHGVAGVRNGPGKTVLLRADMNALPVREQTGLPYASQKTMKGKDSNLQLVMHACGHDMQVAMLLACSSLSSGRSVWSDGLICLSQLREEASDGAQAMIDDGMKAGAVALASGPVLTTADFLSVRIPGIGGHSSTPQDCVDLSELDPIVLASHIVVRLQTIVSREVGPKQFGLITCGSLHAGRGIGNVIPDHAETKINVRAYLPEVKDKMLKAVERVVNAGCEVLATLMIPEINTFISTPPTIIDGRLVEILRSAFEPFFKEKLITTEHGSASEDFVNLAMSKIPYAYWWIGCDAVDSPRKMLGNHSPFFAPAVEPTICTGLDAFAIAVFRILEKR
ncbi:bacterial exopeptidase dimerization domain-containing protein [Cenococcum geophilum 1.58]|uniref:bacterial exopeptidase dimerization domain-containing protein n=1 Tax=Cenococcum geophilum 1.58 TaxID=794803 RepID=UPI00359011FA|nr:bacterial exopeptidase dimerization domain-containing protein [Cenococcum geophilum 1.58]